MENRKISELNDKSFSSFDDITVNLYIPAIINEGNGYENVKIGLKDLLRLVGGGSSSGSSSGGSSGYDSNIIDQMRSSITALQSAVTSLQDASRYPTHKIILQHPTDSNDHTEYQLPCGYGAQSKSITIFSEIVGQPKFYVDFFVDRPMVTSNNTLIVAGAGTVYSYNGTLTYKGGTIESATADIWYRTTGGNLVAAATDVALIVQTPVLDNVNATDTQIALTTTIDIGSITVETVEVVLKINGQTVGDKAIVQVNVNNSVEIKGIVL